MKARPADFDDVTRLISGLLDGTLSPDEGARLERRMGEDAEVRGVYLQMVDQEIEFACLLAPDRDRIPGAMSAVIEQETALPRGRRIHAGWWMAAAAAIALTAVFWPRHTPAPPDGEAVVWSGDIESGDATGWTGAVVSEGLPAGSKFGIRSVDQTMAGAVVSQIQLPADWERGLFTLTSRSTLHITYKRNTPGGWLDVFMHTNGERAEAPQNSMFMLRQGLFPGAAGRWQTATLPFSQFVRKISDPAKGEPSFVGGAPRDGERVFVLSFGGSPGFDLVIDRIWITPDGPDTATILPLP